jgi:citrate synthase
MAGNEGKAGTVGDLMSHPVVTVSPTDTVAEAAARMAGKQVGSVVVTDEADRAVGILTERDLIKVASVGHDPNAATVGEYMTPDPDVVSSATTTDEAFQSLSTHSYRHIPVVDDGKLVGIVSLRDLMRISQIIPVDKLTIDVPPGLEGVIVSDTTIGQVRGSEGFYHYRQYNAVELAAKRTFEDVWYLMYRGELPTLAERKAFMDEIVPLRELPPELKEFLPLIVKAQGDNFRPLDAVRAAYAIVCSGWPSWLDTGIDEVVHQGMRTCAVLPTLLMGLYRIHTGQQPIDPNPELTYAENYLYMLTGEVPSAEFASAIEKYLISTVDHGFNASTFTSRVITSTGADLGGAVLGAMGALSGPLHGGAPSRALDMVDEIGTPDNADAWIRDAIGSGSKLMGFGHRVYKTDDPRSVMLRGVAKEIGGPLYELAEHIERRAVAILEEMKPGRKLYTNVEFYGGLVMERVGLPRSMFTPTFTSSRTVGWTANIIEQASDNRLIRPTSKYVGPPPPQPVPAAE